MQKIETFLNSKETYDKVLNYLLTHDEKNMFNELITSEGNFIAGGSVANIIISLLHGGRPIINDIDIYKGVNSPLGGGTTEDWYPSTYVGEDGIKLIDDAYGRVYTTDNGSRMRVVKHSRKNVFNVIEYIYELGPYNTRGEKTKEMVILEGFDLNCCKAGLDIVNQKVIYTPEFVEFLETKILKVVNPCSPIQTTIRLYKKMRDLNCTCDLLHEIRFLTVAFNKIGNESHITKFIGPETYEKYLKIKDFVDQYFKIYEPKSKDKLSSLLKLKFEHKKSAPKMWVFEPVLNFDIFEDVYTINELKRVWELLYRPKSGEEQDKINQIFYKGVFLDTKEGDQWERIEYKSDSDDWFGPTREVRISAYSSNRYTYQMLMTKKNYHKCDFTLNQVDTVDRFLSVFSLNGLLKNCDTLVEHYETIQTLVDLRHKKGAWVFDFFENIRNHKFTLDNLFGYRDFLKGKITRESITRIIEMEEKFRNTRKLINMNSIKKPKFTSY